MSDKPVKPVETEQETPVDRFEHEIEELERPLGRTGARQWLVACVLAAGLVAAFFMFSLIQKKTTDQSHSAITSIDLLLPRSSLLTEKPARFQWESIAGAVSYMLTVQEEGGQQDLIVRTATTNSVQLSTEEMGRLARGGRYSWKVLARSRDGWTVGEGRSSFSL